MPTSFINERFKFDIKSHNSGIILYEKFRCTNILNTSQKMTSLVLHALGFVVSSVDLNIRIPFKIKRKASAVPETEGITEASKN